MFFHPDPTIFPKIEFDPTTIRERLEVASYLHRGVKVVFDDATSGNKMMFQHDEGLVDYLRKIVVERCGEARPRSAVHPAEGQRAESGARAAVDRSDG